DGARDLDAPLRVADEVVDRAGDAGRHLVEALVPLIGLDAIRRNQNVLRRGAHLATVEREGEGQVAAHSGEVVSGIHDDRVDAGFFGVDLRLVRVLLKPVAELAGPGEVDDAYLRPRREHAGQALARLLRGERDQVRVESRLGEDLARDPHRDRKRQHGTRMRLDDYGVAGRERGEETGVGVPGREGVASDDQG